MRRALMAALALCGAAANAEARAQTPAPAPDQASADGAENSVGFAADFFARFAPQNALDMVRRVPGFTLDEGEDRRGFSGAAGNVLIDGRRPSAKSQDLESILSRIPASQVLRVELIRDTSSTTDAAGQSTLVNIVRTPSAGDGVWETTLEQTDNGRVSPSGEASWSGRRGALDYSIGASRVFEYRPLDGGRTLLKADGALDQRFEEYWPRTFREAEGNGEATFPLLGGSLRLNGSFDRWQFQSGRDGRGFDDAGALEVLSTFVFEERQQTEEAGFNFDRTLGAVSLELIGLATRRQYATDEFDSTLKTGAESASTFEQAQRRDSGESILRGTLSWPLSPSHRFTLGGEIAYNSLDARLRLAENGAPVELEAANVLVEETRGEAFATLAWRASPRWTVDATLGAETSTLSQSGDTNLETELAYIKPSVQVTRRIGERNQVRARVWRDVNQLDFDDFVSSAALADDIIVSGNPNLRPENSWRAEIAGDWRFGQDGAVGLRLFHWRLDDAADVVQVITLVPDGDDPDDDPDEVRFDAPGNIGSGWVRGVQLTATVPLDFVLRGARLTVDGTLQDSEVTDPVTGRPRITSEFNEFLLEAEFRHDVPAWRLAWGLEYDRGLDFTIFRFNETDRNEEGPYLNFYAETTAIRGLKARFYAANILDPGFQRERRFFDGDRNGSPGRIELRDRWFGPFWGLVLSGTL